jgi:hypothetical protein
MASVQLALGNVPSGATEGQLQQVLKPLGRVISVRKARGGWMAEIDSATIQAAIDSSGIGEIRLGDLRAIDSSGIGELTNVTVRLA